MKHDERQTDRHTHTHTRTHARTNARTHTHTHTNRRTKQPHWNDHHGIGSIGSQSPWISLTSDVRHNAIGSPRIQIQRCICKVPARTCCKHFYKKPTRPGCLRLLFAFSAFLSISLTSILFAFVFHFIEVAFLTFLLIIWVVRIKLSMRFAVSVHMYR